MMRAVLPIVSIVAVLAVAACGPSDPRTEVLEDRARFKVEPLDWATTPENAVQMTVRVTAPMRGSKLEKLSFRIDLVGDTGEVVDSEWKTVDLTTLGTRNSEEFMLRLEPREFTITELRVDPVTSPTPEDEPHIAELP